MRVLAVRIDRDGWDGKSKERKEKKGLYTRAKPVVAKAEFADAKALLVISPASTFRRKFGVVSFGGVS